MTSAASFEGFPAEAQKVLRDLKSHNTREWFAKNESRYRQFIEAPAKSFAHETKLRVGRLREVLPIYRWLRKQ